MGRRMIEETKEEQVPRATIPLPSIGREKPMEVKETAPEDTRDRVEPEEFDGLGHA